MKVRRLKPLSTREELLKRMERWKDPRNVRALMDGLRELRLEIERQEKTLAALRARVEQSDNPHYGMIIARHQPERRRCTSHPSRAPRLREVLPRIADDRPRRLQEQACDRECNDQIRPRAVKPPDNNRRHDNSQIADGIIA